jgi:hypothetical protein
VTPIVVTWSTNHHHHHTGDYLDSHDDEITNITTNDGDMGGRNKSDDEENDDTEDRNLSIINGVSTGVRVVIMLGAPFKKSYSQDNISRKEDGIESGSREGGGDGVEEGIHIYMYIYVFIYIFIYLYMYLCICIYIYMCRRGYGEGKIFGSDEERKGEKKSIF